MYSFCSSLLWQHYISTATLSRWRFFFPSALVIVLYCGSLTTLVKIEHRPRWGGGEQRVARLGTYVLEDGRDQRLESVHNTSADIRQQQVEENKKPD